MLSSRAKWFVVIGIALVLGALGVGGYYYLSGKAKIGASGEENYSWLDSNYYWLVNPAGNGDPLYITAGQSGQKAIIKLQSGSGKDIQAVKIYPMIKSATCNQIGATACFEQGTTPINANFEIGSTTNGVQIVTISMPGYDTINAATIKDIYGATGYTLPYDPEGGGSTTKAGKMFAVNSSGDEIEIYPNYKSYVYMIKPPVAATQSKELESGNRMSFCDISRNVTGNTLQCDAFINFSSIGFKSLTPIPSGEGAYIAGATGGSCSYYDNNAGKCLQAFVATNKPGTYRIFNTDYKIVATGEENGSTTESKILTFTANPEEITSGESSTLSWTTQNVNTCTLNGEVVSKVNGSTAVSPTVTTAYALTCTNSSTSKTVNAVTTVVVSETGGGGAVTGCGSGEIAYKFTPNAWNLNTNNYTPKGATKLSDYYNSFLGKLAVITYSYGGSGTSYTSNPSLSSVPPGIGYWFTSGAKSPICISSSNASANTATTVTIPSSIAMVGNPTAKAKKMSDIKFTYNGETMSLLDASNKSTPLVKAMFFYTPGADSYEGYYASAYKNYVTGGAKFIESAMSKSLAPGSGFWIILNSKITGSTLTF